MLSRMFESNPQMRQLLEQRPELRSILEDPETLRRAAQAQNPALRREMMRSNDRAIANISSMPGGERALARMYEEVQQPMYEASIEAARRAAGVDNGSSPQAAAAQAAANAFGTDVSAGSHPNSQPLPNPWGASGSPPAATTSPGQQPSNNTSSRPFRLSCWWSLGAFRRQPFLPNDGIPLAESLNSDQECNECRRILRK